MSFCRSNSGVTNLHLFYDSDVIVFTEGGSRSYSVDEVEDGKYSTSATDIKFWGSILKTYNYHKKIEFRAIGSKTASKYICEKITNGEVSNIIVTKDRDLDQYLDILVDSPFILYTKGYSWENDVFVKDLIISQIKNMLFEMEISDEIHSIIDAAYDDFRIYGCHLFKLELLFRKNGISFISNLNGERFFNSKIPPRIDREQVKNLLITKKTELHRPAINNLNEYVACPFLNNYGKLIESLSIAIINYICKTYSDYKSIPKKMIESAMIERFSEKISLEKDDYYFGIIEKLKYA